MVATSASRGDTGGVHLQSFSVGSEFGLPFPAGRVIFEVAPFKSGRYGAYLYLTDQGKWEILTGNLPVINTFLAERLPASVQVSGGYEGLSEFLLATLLPVDARVIDDALISRFRAQGDEVTSKALLPYLFNLKIQPEVEGWQLSLNFVCCDGTIEAMTVSGTNHPLQVDSWKLKVRTRIASFKPLIDVM